MLRVFSHYIPTSIILLIIVEILVFYSSVYIGVELRFYGSENKEALISLIEPLNFKALIFAFLMLFSMTAMGLHTRNIVDHFSGMMIRVILGFCLGFIVTAIIYYIYPGFFLGRGVVAITFATAFIGILISRIIYWRFDNHNIFKRRLLIMGAGGKGKLLEDQIRHAKKRGYEIIGFVDVNQSEVRVNKERILEIKSTLLDLCVENRVDEIVLAMDDRRKGFPLSGLLDCKMKGVIVHDILDSLERITGHIEIDALHTGSIIFSSGFTKAVSPNGIKRAFDVFASLIILILTGPFIVLTYIAIWISSFGRDPVFYKQLRIGLSEVPFEVRKFRSMKVDAEKNGAQFAQKNDSRVTLIGGFIRKTRIDELPQLFNVLKGEMSFVGPRPERPEFVLGYNNSIPNYILRHAVKPGITGWAQICYPYGETSEDTKKKLQYDLYYIKNYSLFLDMTIMLQTIQVVLFGQGAR